MSDAAVAASIDEFRAVIRGQLEAEQLAGGHLDDFIVDGVAPDMAVEPATAQQLKRCLAEASEANVTIVPFGGGTHIALGNIPERYDVALSLRRLHRIIEYEPADLTVTVEAGVRLVDLQSKLAEHGQFLPLDPPGGDEATVGGVLAANASGPLRHAFGTGRDWLLGISVVHADGTMTKGGGRVVKNVAGYDMPKLYIGSLGTLGVIAEATFKVAPLPKSESTVAIGCDSPHSACTLLFAARDAGLSLNAAELLSPPAAYAVLGEPRWMLLMRASGGHGAVQRTLRELHELGESIGARFEIRDTREAWSAWRQVFDSGELTLRASVTPAEVADVVAILDRQLIGSAPMLSATVAAGVIRAQAEPTREARAGAIVMRAREVVKRFAGTMVVEAASAALKHDIDVFGDVRSDFAIMKRLKEEFDPHRTLSPGRFLGRL